MVWEPYSRSIHKEEPPVYNCPPGFNNEAAMPGEQESTITGLISDCNEDIQAGGSTFTGRAAFTSVSRLAENRTQPVGLYRH